MASPFSFSGRSSYSSQPIGTSISRPPIYNPYDKFTQPEFDAWIGGITGALRDALGLESEVIAQSAYESQSMNASYSDDEEQEVQEIIEEEDESSDESIDSFEASDVQRVGKGKARDPRDGPGFFKCESRIASIFVEDSEEEEGSGEQEEEDEEEEQDGEDEGESVGSDEKIEGESYDVDHSDEDEKIQSWEKAEQSSRAHFETQQRVAMPQGQEVVDEEEDEEEGDDDDEDEDEEGEEEGDESGKSEGDEGDEEEQEKSEGESRVEPEHLEQAHSTYQAQASPRAPSPVLILSSDEEVEEVDPVYEFNEEDAESPSDEVPMAPSSTNLPQLDLGNIGPPRQPKTDQPQLNYAIVVDGDDEGKDADLDDEISQPLENDTSFPPYNMDGPNGSTINRPIEIRDPWIGPQTYAEDYYSGGDVREGQEGLTADRLSEWDDLDINATHIPGVELQGTDVNLAAGQALDESDADNLSTEAATISVMREEPLPNHILNPVRAPDAEPVTLDTSPFLPTKEADYSGGRGLDGETAADVAQQSIAKKIETQNIQITPDPKSPQIPRPITPPNEQLDINSIYDDIGGDPIVIELDWTFLDAITKGEDFTIEVGVGEPSQSRAEVPSSEPSGVNRTSDNFSSDNSEPQETSSYISDAVASPKTSIPFDLQHPTIVQTPLITSPPYQEPNLSLPTSEVSGDLGSTPIPHHESVEITSKLDSEPLRMQAKPIAAELNFTDEVKRLALDEAQQMMGQELGAASPIIVSSSSLHNDVDMEGYYTQGTAVEASPDEVINEDAATFVEVLEKPGVAPPDFDQSGYGASQSRDASPPYVSRTEQPEEPPLANNDISILEESEHTTSPIEEIPMPVVAEAGIPDPITDFRTSSPKQLVVDHTETSEEPTPITLPLHDAEEKLDGAHDFPLQTSLDRLFTPVPDFADFVNPLDSDVTQAAAPSLSERNDLGSDHVLGDQSNEVPPVPHSFSIDIQAPQDIGQSENEVHHVDENVHAISATQSTGQMRSPSPKSMSLPQEASSSPPPVTVAMHKTSGPILLADPYPASLSTPGTFLDSTKDSPYAPLDGDTSQESSFTVDQDSTDMQQNLKEDDYPESLDGTGLLYPTPQPSNRDQTSPPPEIAKEVGPTSEDLHEMDADGDLDPDIVATSNRELASTPSIEPPVRTYTQSETGHDHTHTDQAVGQVDISKNTRSTNVQTSSPIAQIAEREDIVSATQAPLARTAELEDDLPAILIIKKPAAAQDGRKEGSYNRLNDGDNFTQTLTKRKGRQSMRKYDSTTTAITSPKATSKRAGKQKASRPATILQGTGEKSKGKGKEKRGSPVSKGSLDARSISSMSSSDASSAIKLLRHSSRNGSRASSVASNTPSDIVSPITQPSPTNIRNSGSSRFQALPLPPPPLLHKHSHNRPNAQPALPATLYQASIPRMLPSSRSLDTSPASTTVSTSSQPTAPRRSTSFANSPTTRSNCRYHKISIPREEDGPRVFFLVPGCSLGDAELLKEEEILDHGTASFEDGRHMTPNLDAYAFDPYVLSVLRLLVGVDMLREQEVYYVPQFKFPVPLNAHYKQPLSRTSTDNASHASVTSRRDSNASAMSPLSPIARTPVTELASASSAVRSPIDKRETPSSIFSYSDSELTDEDEVLRSNKRPRLSSPVAPKPALGDMGPPMTESRSRKMKPRRSIRLDTEYKPDADDGEDSQHEETYSGTRRGAKRSRVSNFGRESEADVRKQKKQKVSLNDGQPS